MPARPLPVNAIRLDVPTLKQRHKSNFLPRNTYLKPDTKTLKDFKSFGSGSVSLAPRYAPGIALIELRNAEKKNAMSPKMMVDLTRAVGDLETLCKDTEDEKEGSDLVGVVLCGEGGDLCSGFDLSSTPPTKAFHPSFSTQMSTLMHQTLHRLRRLPLITLASISGHAIGGGAELALSCDYRLISPHTRLKFVQIGMGVTPGWGGGVYLQSHLRHGKVLEILGTGRSLGAEELRRLELAEVVDGEKICVREAGVEFLRKFTHDAQGNLRPAHVVREMKRLVSAASGVGTEEEWEMLEKERESFVRLWGQWANRQAVEKFVGTGKGERNNL
ncbi:hypothetical protein HK097_010743 [Rhizophlyctis rosea]|uniref:Ethylmalonyl-CoA decarboxylase n=1 Tax=Rhizophlyctis rosea TaxID=64517 RepID=A0AAD5SF40_9FUNG|nr:hypothetical protein HK097_010743 [Rhizophlyctis rosea]